MRFHSLIQDKPGWKTLEDDTCFANPYAEIHIVKIATPARPDGVTWTVAHRKGACMIAPITEDGCLLMVRQERIPLRASVWEFPAGQIDENGLHLDAVIRETALRELREETGHELGPDGELIPMGTVFASPGFMDEHCHLFAARGVVQSPHGAAHDSGEVITECKAFTLAEFQQMIASGEIRDSNSMAAFAKMIALKVLRAEGVESGRC